MPEMTVDKLRKFLENLDSEKKIIFHNDTDDKIMEAIEYYTTPDAVIINLE